MLNQNNIPLHARKKRLLFYELVPKIRHKNALVITGMRQVGKTVLMRQLFEEVLNSPKLWFDLENPLDQKVFEDIDYHNIYERLRKTAHATSAERLFVFIDEIQNFPEITKIIKFLIDHYQVKFIVTGSSNYYLKNLFPESLAGRKFLYQLPPLSFSEILFFKDVLSLDEIKKMTLADILQPRSIIDHAKRQEHYEEYLQFGGFPEVVITPDSTTKRQIIKNIFASFFEKDLKLLSDYTDAKELRDLILLLVPRVGSLVDVTKLASELRVTRAKVYGYLEFLQGIFFIRLLPRYSKSIDRSVAAGKKIYFTDSGILTTAGAVNDAQLFENTVVNQLGAYGDVSFYNHRNQEEIDILLDKTIALEVKLTGTPADIVHVEKLARKLGLSDWYVVSKKSTEHIKLLSPLFF